MSIRRGLGGEVSPISQKNDYCSGGDTGFWLTSTDHLETLFETGSLKNKTLYDDLHEQLEVLGKKLNLFIQAIEHNITSNQ